MNAERRMVISTEEFGGKQSHEIGPCLQDKLWVNTLGTSHQVIETHLIDSVYTKIYYTYDIPHT